MSEYINLSGMKALLEPIVHLIHGKAERPDWNENDSSSPDYIENKPFYEEIRIAELVPKTTVYIDTDGGGYAELPNMSAPFTVGDTYYVTLNGVQYECVAWAGDHNGIYIGNGDIYGGEGLGGDEPFSCDSYDDGRVYLNAKTTGDYTISISGNYRIIHKIDEKYLPEIKLTGVAETGSYDDLIDKVAVEYVEQNLTDEQKEIARENIGAVNQEDLDSKMNLQYLTAPDGLEFYNMFFCNDRFIAQIYDNGSTGKSTNRIMYSLDGFVWQFVENIDIGGNVTDACYGNGTYIVHGGKSSIAYSTDFVSWTVVKDAMPLNNVTSICYGADKFVAVNHAPSGNPNLAYSTDGITWTTVTLPTCEYLRDVHYGNGKYIAISQDKFAYSEDGISWTETDGIGEAGAWDICYGDGKFVVISCYTNYYIWYSQDGIIWNKVERPYGETSSLTYCYGKFVTVGLNTYLYSEDGITWEKGKQLDSYVPNWARVCGGTISYDPIFIACCRDVYSTHDYAISYDGINWTHYVISQNNSNETESVANTLTTKLINNFYTKQQADDIHANIRTTINSVSSLVGDTSVSEQIAAAIQFATEDEILDMMASIDALPVLADENDTIYTDEADNILLI